MRTRAVVIALLFAAVLVPAGVRAQAGPWLLSPGEYYSEISGSKSFSDTYYDATGARFGFPLSQRYETRSLRFYNEIGWKKRFGLVLGVPLKSLTYNVPDVGYERTETGFGDLQIGVRIKLHAGARALALQADWLAPAGYQTRTFPSLGGGKQIAQERLLVGTSIARWSAFAEGEFRYLSFFEALPSQAGVGAIVGKWFGSSLLVSGHYRYGRVLNTSVADLFSNTSSSDPRFQEVGPELRYRVDDRLDVFAGSWHTASGRSINHSDEFYAGMAFRQTKLNRLQGLIGNKSRP
jgi:hypothetical protein